MRPNLIFAGALFLLLMVVVTPMAQALPVGAPVRTLEVGGFSLSGSIGYTDIEIDDRDVTSKSFFFKGAFGGWDGMTPYLKLGFADLEEGSFEGSLDFGFGGGLLLDILTQESGAGFRVSLDSQLSWVSSREGSDTHDLFEGQLALVGSTKSGGTNSYAGLATSFLSFDSTDDNGKAHLFFGLDYYMDYNFYFNAEAHLFGQDVLSIGVGYLF